MAAVSDATIGWIVATVVAFGLVVGMGVYVFRRARHKEGLLGLAAASALFAMALISTATQEIGAWSWALAALSAGLLLAMLIAWRWPDRWFWIAALVVSLAAAVGVYFLADAVNSPLTLAFASGAAARRALTVRFAVPQTSAGALSRLWGGDVARQHITLKRLEYYLLSLQLMTADAVTCHSGGGWTADSGNGATWSILAPEHTPDVYDAYGYAEAEADTEHYVDLLDTGAVQAKLALGSDNYFGSASATANAEFVYLALNWMKPVRFEAETNPDAWFGDGATATATASPWTVDTQEVQQLFTRQATTAPEELCDPAVEATGVAFCRPITTVDDLSVGPSERTTVVLNNGGSIVRLFTPISRARLDAAPHTLYLLVDPHQSLRAQTRAASAEALTATNAASRAGNLRDAQGRYFELGLLTVTPLLLAPNEVVVREQYRILLELDYDVLLQLYWVGTELRAIDAGVTPVTGELTLPDTAPLGGYNLSTMTQDSTTNTWSFGQFVCEGADDWGPLIADFTAGVEGGTCTLRCLYLVCGDETVMQNPETTVTRSYVLLSRTALALAA